MPRYVFHVQVADGQAQRLQELNEQYGEASCIQALPGWPGSRTPARRPGPVPG